MKALFVVVMLSLAMVASAFGQAWWTLPEGSPERAAAQKAARQEANITAQRAAEAAARVNALGGGPMGPEQIEKTIMCLDIADSSTEMDRRKYGVASKDEAYRTYKRCMAQK